MLRFPPPKGITLKEDKTKVYILLQTAVARIFIPEFSLRVEQSEVVECGLRLLSALSEVCIERLRGALLENCLLLERALRQRLWEQGYTTVFTQCLEVSELTRKALADKHVVELLDLVPYNKNAVDVQNHLKCSYQEATALHAFTTICLAHQVTVSFQLIDPELQLQVQPSAHYKPEYQHIQNCPKYHLVCYDDSSGELLCHRFTQCSARVQTIAVPLPASVPYERVRCVAISSVVGLDVVIPSIAARLNPSHPSASNGSSAAGAKAPKKTSSSTQQQITASMTPKRLKATKASEGSAHVVSPLKPPLPNPTQPTSSETFEQYNYDPTPLTNQPPVPRESPDQGKTTPHQRLITDYKHMYNNAVNYDSIAPHVQAQTQSTNTTSSTATTAYVPNPLPAPVPAPVVKEISPYLPSNYKLANYKSASAAVPAESSKYIPLSEASGSKWHRGDNRKDMTSVDTSVPYELRIVRQKGSELNAPVSFTNPAKRLRQNFASPTNTTHAGPPERVATCSRMIPPPPPLTSLQAFATQAIPLPLTNTHPQPQMQGSYYGFNMMAPSYFINQDHPHQHRPEVALLDTPPSGLTHGPFDFMRNDSEKHPIDYGGETTYPYNQSCRQPHSSSSSLYPPDPEPTYLEPVFRSERYREQHRKPAPTYDRWSEHRIEDSTWPAALPPRMQSPPLTRPPPTRSTAPFFDSEPLLPPSSYSKPAPQSALWPITTARDRLQSPRPRMSDPFDLASPPTDPLTRLSQILPRSASTAHSGTRDADNRSHLLALPIGGRHTLATDRGASEHPMVSVSRAPSLASNVGRNMP